MSGSGGLATLLGVVRTSLVLDSGRATVDAFFLFLLFVLFGHCLVCYD